MANLKQAIQAIGSDIRTVNNKIKQLTTSVSTKTDETQVNGLINTAFDSKIGDTSTVLDAGTKVVDLLQRLKTYMEANADVVSEATVDSKVNAAITQLVDSAPENLNTLSELVAEIQKNGGGLQGLLTAVGSLDSLTTTDKTSVVAAINEVQAALVSLTAAQETGDMLEAYTTARGVLES